MRTIPRLHKALGLAILMHVLLALMVPDMPRMIIQGVARDSALKVFLQKKPEPEKFEQSLNQPSISAQVWQELQESSASASSADQADDEQISDDVPEVSGSDSTSRESEQAGDSEEVAVQRDIMINSVAIRQFTDYEANLYAEQNPDEVEAFSRSFVSHRSVRRRNRTDGYKDRFGDVYVRSSTSSGDVCFVQQSNKLDNEPSVRTVDFYRCDSEPKKFELDPKG